MDLELLIRVCRPTILTIVSVTEPRRLCSHIRTERLIATTRLNQRLISHWGRSVQVKVAGGYQPVHLEIRKARFQDLMPQGHRPPSLAVLKPWLAVFRELTLAEHNQRLLRSIQANSQVVPALLALHPIIQELNAQWLLVPIEVIAPRPQATPIHRRAALAILQSISHLGRTTIRHTIAQIKHPIFRHLVRVVGAKALLTEYQAIPNIPLRPALAAVDEGHRESVAQTLLRITQYLASPLAPVKLQILAKTIQRRLPSIL